MKAIWKFGPISRGETKKVMGRPVNVGIQSGNFYVWRSEEHTSELQSH